MGGVVLVVVLVVLFIGLLIACFALDSAKEQKERAEREASRRRDAEKERIKQERIAKREAEYQSIMLEMKNYLCAAVESLPSDIREVAAIGGFKKYGIVGQHYTCGHTPEDARTETLLKLGWADLAYYEYHGYFEYSEYFDFSSAGSFADLIIAVLDGSVYISPTYGNCFFAYNSEGKRVTDISAAHPVMSLVLPFKNILYYEVTAKRRLVPDPKSDEFVFIELFYMENETISHIPLQLRTSSHSDIAEYEKFCELFTGKSIEEVEAQKQAEEEAAKQRAMQATDALFKLKTLLDQGIITQEEFDKRKGEFLSDLQ